MLKITLQTSGRNKIKPSASNLLFWYFPHYTLLEWMYVCVPRPHCKWVSPSLASRSAFLFCYPLWALARPICIQIQGRDKTALSVGHRRAEALKCHASHNRSPRNSSTLPKIHLPQSRSCPRNFEGIDSLLLLTALIRASSWPYHSTWPSGPRKAKGKGVLKRNPIKQSGTTTVANRPLICT